MSQALIDELTALYEENHDRLVKRFSNQCSGSIMDGEDIVQEAFSRALQYVDSAPPEGGKPLTDWLFKICHNCFIDNRKADRMGGAVDIEEHAETLEYNPQEGSMKYARQLLKHSSKLTENMDDRTQRGVKLYFFNGYKCSDLNRLLGGSPDYWERTVKKIQEAIVETTKRQGYFSKGSWVLVEE